MIRSTNHIYTQINDFKCKHKINNSFICTLCNKSIEWKDTHADHIVSFKDIKDEFKKHNPYNGDYLKNSETLQWNFTDKIYEEKWKEFHLQKAELQILCKSCNLNK